MQDLYNSIFYVSLGASDCINTYLLSLGLVNLQKARVLQIQNYVKQLTVSTALQAPCCWPCSRLVLWALPLFES